MHALLFLVSLTSLAASPLLVRWSHAPAEVIGFWRLLGAWIVMFFLHQISPPKADQQPNALAHGSFASKGRFFSFLAGVCFFLHLWTFFLAVQNTRIANSTILYSLNPLFTAIFSVFLLKETYQKRWSLSFVLAFIAILLIFGGQSQFLSDTDAGWGNILALLSALLFSAYILCGTLARRTLSNSLFTSFAYLSAAGCFSLVIALRGLPWITYPPKVWIVIGLMVLFPTLLGHALFTYLLKFFNVNFLSCGKLIEPVMSSLAATVLFSESLSLSTILAFVLSGSSLLLLLEPWKYRLNRQKNKGATF